MFGNNPLCKRKVYNTSIHVCKGYRGTHVCDISFLSPSHYFVFVNPIERWPVHPGFLLYIYKGILLPSYMMIMKMIRIPMNQPVWCEVIRILHVAQSVYLPVRDGSLTAGSIAGTCLAASLWFAIQVGPSFFSLNFLPWQSAVCRLMYP